MQGESHDTNEVDGREPVTFLAGLDLALDGEGGIEHGPVVEGILRRPLDLHDKSLSVLVIAFYIDPNALLPGILVSTLLRGIGERNDLAFGNDCLEKQLHQPLGLAILFESSLEPVIHQHVRKDFGPLYVIRYHIKIV